MIPPPAETRLEPVTVTAYAVTASALNVGPFAIKVDIIVPASTSCKIQTLPDPGDVPGTDYTIAGAARETLEAGNRPMSNDLQISRTAGVGTIVVLVYRVTNKAATSPKV